MAHGWNSCYAAMMVLFCLPALVAGQTPQTAGASSASQSPGPSDPQLMKRPPAAAPRQASAVTPEGRIRLDVLVTDAAGKPMLGLGPQDFTVLDDGAARKILSFRSFDGVNVKPDPPVQVILVVDTANLPFQQVAFVRSELERFLRQNNGHLAAPVSIFHLSEAGLRVQQRPSVDGNALVAVLNQIKGGLQTVYGAMGADADLRHFQVSVKQLATIAANEAQRPGRKLVIWVGPGWPMLNSNNYRFSEKDQLRYFDTIVELSTKIREARMSLYSVAPASSTTVAGMYTTLYRNFLKGVQSPRQADTGNLALKVLATQSGGRILGPDNNLVGQIDSCIAEANAFYSLTFNPPPAAHADEYHDLRVQVSQPGVTVRTNTGYYDQP